MWLKKGRKEGRKVVEQGGEVKVRRNVSWRVWSADPILGFVESR